MDAARDVRPAEPSTISSEGGASTCQVTLLTPWVGSNGYEQPFRDGFVLGQVGGQPIKDYQYDGNHCLATSDAYPWRRQINMLASYVSFYNPINLLLALPRFDKVWADRILCQLVGMFGVAKSIYHSHGWLKRLISGPIERLVELPRSRFPMVAPNGVSPELIHGGMSCDSTAGCRAASSSIPRTDGVGRVLNDNLLRNVLQQPQRKGVTLMKDKPKCGLRQVVLLRHGESDWNKENLFTGWTDVDLSERGREEGQVAGRGLKEHGFTFDVAFTSALKRAIPLVYELDEDLKPIRHYYLGDAERVQKAMQAVASQASLKD